MRSQRWMVYGANGYTGRQVAEQAVAQGLSPVLAGRNRRAIASLATQLRCEYRVFSLKKAEPIVEHLAGVSAVLHCAGPFAHTSRPMVEACLRSHCHYLDITGEIEVLEWIAGQHDRAARARVALLPAVGFDVVPSDCLAAMLAERLPQATHLQLAFTAPSRVSPGTARTIFEGLPGGGRVRQDGQIVRVPLAWKSREIPFRDGARHAVTVPWGDVATAWHTTGIDNIEVYTTLPAAQAVQLRRFRPVFWLLGRWPLRPLLGHMIQRTLAKATHQRLPPGRASFWGRVADEQGNSVEATMETPGGYELTVTAALAAIQRVLDGRVPAGFSTPANAFGPDFVLTLPDADLRWG